MRATWEKWGFLAPWASCPSSPDLCCYFELSGTDTQAQCWRIHLNKKWKKVQKNEKKRKNTSSTARPFCCPLAWKWLLQNDFCTDGAWSPTGCALHFQDSIKKGKLITLEYCKMLASWFSSCAVESVFAPDSAFCYNSRWSKFPWNQQKHKPLGTSLAESSH